MGRDIGGEGGGIEQMFLEENCAIIQSKFAEEMFC